MTRYDGPTEVRRTEVSGDLLSTADNNSEDVVPRFCPGCGREAMGGSALCAHCGERVRDQGYCPICERFWRLPAGAPCPKHEVELDDPPPRTEPHTPGSAATHWVTVETFVDALKAEAPRIRLEAEGIPTFLEGARMGSLSMYDVAIGGVKLQVPQSLAADARVLLAQNWSPPAPVDDLDDAWEELAPEPGSVRRSVMKGVILVILFGPLVLALLAKLIGL
jgi:hypothetical protein